MLTGILKGIWHYRFYIASAIRADFQARVARSRLGVMWVVISPLAQVAIFAFVLSAIMTQRLPGIDSPFAYSIYLLAGFLAWTLFVEIVNRCLTIFIDNANALKKIVFPRIALPLIAAGAALVNNMIFLAALCGAYLLLGHNPLPGLVWYPVLALVTAALALGLGLTLGVLNVFMRDIGQLVQILLQLGFWLTPIVYMPTILPELYRDWIKINPMFWVVDGYHRSFAFLEAPQPLVLIGLSGLALGLMALALFLFRKASGEMVDVL